MTERLSGYKPDHPTVAAFLGANPSPLNTPYTSSVNQAPQLKYVNTPKKFKEVAERENCANTSVDSFAFQGTKHVVKHWKDVLVGISEIMLARHRNQFD